MDTKIIRTLLKKEMLDVFRDKKTVIMMLIVPVLLYPIVFIGAMQVMAFVNSSMKEQEYRIAVEMDDEGAFYDRLVRAGEQDRGKTRRHIGSRSSTPLRSGAVSAHGRPRWRRRRSMRMSPHAIPAEGRSTMCTISPR